MAVTAPPLSFLTLLLVLFATHSFLFTGVAGDCYNASPPPTEGTSLQIQPGSTLCFTPTDATGPWPSNSTSGTNITYYAPDYSSDITTFFGATPYGQSCEDAFVPSSQVEPVYCDLYNLVFCDAVKIHDVGAMVPTFEIRCDNTDFECDFYLYSYEMCDPPSFGPEEVSPDPVAFPPEDSVCYSQDEAVPFASASLDSTCSPVDVALEVGPFPASSDATARITLEAPIYINYLLVEYGHYLESDADRCAAFVPSGVSDYCDLSYEIECTFTNSWVFDDYPAIRVSCLSGESASCDYIFGATDICVVGQMPSATTGAQTAPTPTSGPSPPSPTTPTGPSPAPTPPITTNVPEVFVPASEIYPVGPRPTPPPSPPSPPSTTLSPSASTALSRPEYWVGASVSHSPACLLLLCVCVMGLVGTALV